MSFRAALAQNFDEQLGSMLLLLLIGSAEATPAAQPGPASQLIIAAFQRSALPACLLRVVLGD